MNFPSINPTDTVPTGVVKGMLDKHSVRAGGEVALHDFWDVHQTFHHGLVHACTFEVETYVGACSVSDAFRIDVETATGDYAALDEVLHTLVNSSARYSALSRYVLERNACVLGEDAEDFLVKIVYLIHSFLFLCLSFTICQQN